MPIVYKTPSQIEHIRRAAHLAVSILSQMRDAAVPGVTTAHLDAIAASALADAGAISTAKNWPTYQPDQGFPGHTCISVNDQVVHGVPGPRVLRAGDSVTLDLSLSLDGWCASAATTIPVGPVTPELAHFLKVGALALTLALSEIRPGRNWSLVAARIQQFVESHGYGVVREFVGHGIGRSRMEAPQVPNFPTPRSDFRLREGMTLTIEPIITMGHPNVVLSHDQWTVLAEDGRPAAHFRHTIAVTATGVDILTLPPDTELDAPRE